MSDWEPGTVARFTDPVYGELTGILVGGLSACWHAALPGSDFRCVAADQVTEVRPLVVLDLKGMYEARPQVLRNWAALNDEAGTNAPAKTLRELADAIEEQTQPPKPDEPQGLGALVVASAQWPDGKGFGPVKWASGEGREWVCVSGSHLGAIARWSVLTDVDVIFPGVKMSDLSEQS